MLKEEEIDNTGLDFSSESEDDQDNQDQDDGSITDRRSSIEGISGSSPLSVDFDQEQHQIDDFWEERQPTRPHTLDLEDPPSLNTPLEQQQLNNGTLRTPVQQPQSRVAQATAPTKTKGKRKTKKPNSSVDLDNSRPDNDKTQTQPLQQAKRNQRLQEAARKRKQATMPITTRQNAVGNGEVEENLVQVGETLTTTTNTGEALGAVPRKKTTSSSTVSESSLEKENDPTAESSTKKRKSDGGSSTSTKSQPTKEENYQMWEKVSKHTTKDIDQKCANQRLKDSKTKKEDRLKLVDTLRRRIFELQVCRGKDQVYIRSLEEHVDQLKKDVSKSVSRSKAAKLRVCEEIKDKVVSCTKEELWRSTKFMTCKEDLENGTEKVMSFCGFDEGKTVEEQNSFVVTYNTIVKKALNQQRNYLTAELKKLAFTCFLKKGKPLPNAGVLLACAMRQVSETNEAKFKWYWTQALTKVVNSKQWNKEIFYYHTPTLAKMDSSDPKSKFLFTVSHEAMICLVWENNYEKWQKQYAFTQDPENKGKPQPNLPGKWTTSDSGQAEWGGWSAVGLQEYNVYKKKIRDGRKGRKDDIRAFEQKILAQLREEAGIVADNHEEQLRIARAKKRKLNADKPVTDVRVHKAIATVDEEDEDDEDR